MSTVRFGEGTIRVREGDFCWLRNRRLANRYTCPFLLTLSMWLHRLKGQRAYWYLNMPKNSVFCGYLTKCGSLVEARCLFPHKWIIAECNFWNWRLRKGKAA